MKKFLRKLKCYFGNHRLVVIRGRLLSEHLKCEECGKCYVSTMMGLWKCDKEGRIL